MKRPLIAVLLLTLLTWSCQKQTESIPDFNQLSEDERRLPQNATLGMEVPPGLSIGLFASEPMLVNPTNINVDEKGRVWVCEAFNYRTNLNPEYEVREEGDRILILEDEDGDGQADKSTVFYQGPEINAALGIWVMGSKVIVSCSPDIFIFTDEDGDGKSDKKETLFTGIKGVQHDHGAHAMTFGPDGKLYFNFGNEGYQLQHVDGSAVLDQEGRPVVADGHPYRQGMAFRCNVDGSELEVLAHNFRNNYELAVDAFGNIWQSDNDDDGNRGVRINYVMEYGNYGFTDEMTGAGWRAARIGMNEEIPKRHWHLNDPGVVPNLLQTGSGSPTGIAFYDGDLLPEVFRHQMIHGEAGHNVVRSYPTKPAGAGFTAEVVNLVKGKDNWFRPSDVCTAPDGSIFIADWYDPGVGGHKMGDPKRGRIYRVAPPGITYKMPPWDLSTPENAVQALLNPNLSLRFLAWEKLQGWQLEALPALEVLWQSDNPYHRAQAVWLLGKIKGKESHYINEALSDEDPNIRITGLRLARQADKDHLGLYISKLIKDPNAQVRREVAIALRYLQDPQAPAWWTELALQYDGQDRWYLEALGIASASDPNQCLDHWLNRVGQDWNSASNRDIVWRVRAKAAVPLLANLITDPAASETEIKKYMRAFDFHDDEQADAALAGLLNLSHPLKDKINAFALGQMSQEFVQNSPRVKGVMLAILPGIEGTGEFLTLVRNLGLTDQNQALLRMVLKSDTQELSQESANLLLKNDGLTLITTAIEKGNEQEQKKLMLALGANESEEVKDYLQSLINSGHNYLPQISMEALSQTWGGQHRLFALLENDELPQDLQNKAAVLLLGAFNQDIRTKASLHLTQSAGTDQVLASIPQLMQMNGIAGEGEKVFQQYCITCHQVNENGTNFGPDLSEIGSKLAKDALYGSIIRPSAGINFGYEGYTVHLKNGNSATGFIASETADQITLRTMGGNLKDYPKDQIERREAQEQSLMPEGLHLAMSQQELVDLVAYLSALQSPEDLASR